MDDPITKNAQKQRPVTILAGGCLIVLCILLLGAAVIFGYKQKATRNSPTLTPTPLPTPHILVRDREPANKKAVIYEDFLSNKNNWNLYYYNGKIEIINGKLILQSNMEGASVIGTSNEIVPSAQTYYVQADFTTDTDKAFPYGLVFGLNRLLNTYYVFEVLPGNGGFQLLKFNSGKWSEPVPYSEYAISPYPEPTTLSVYFDKGNIELYINGKLVSTFFDADFFQSRETGVFASNTGYRLIVDNFFVYDGK
jgi:hypothetical protein